MTTPEPREQVEARLREMADRNRWIENSTQRLIDQWLAAEMELRGWR